jgi:hypothetical protein
MRWHTREKGTCRRHFVAHQKTAGAVFAKGHAVALTALTALTALKCR